MKKILGIYGAGGLGREVLDIALRINEEEDRWIDIVFIDDAGHRTELVDFKVLSLPVFATSCDRLEAVIAVGEPQIRKKLYEKLVSYSIPLATVVHPTAIISRFANVEPGVIIGEFSSIHSNAHIGANTIVQPFCCVGHDIIIGRHVVVSTTANIGGNTVVEDCVFIGMNCSVLQNLRIGQNAIVAMGAVVFRNVDDGCTVLGNPARETLGNMQRKALK